MKSILIATLGYEPQVVTLALDSLLERGEPIERVVVVYTDLPVVHEALNQLRIDFQHTRTYKGHVLFDPVLLTNADGPLVDVTTPQQVDACFEAFYQLLRYHKATNASIHLCIAGGRKTMALFAFAAAQLLFDANDHVWHLDSDETLRLSRRLHAAPSEHINLIEVPFMRWSGLPGSVRSSNLHMPVYQAVQQQSSMVHDNQRRQVEYFLSQLSRAERELVIELVKTGLGNSELAHKLHKSVSGKITIEQGDGS